MSAHDPVSAKYDRIFRREDIRDFNSLCRRDRALATTRVKFIASALDIATQPVYLTRDDAVTGAKHSVVVNPHNVDGAAKKIRVASMEEFRSDDPELAWLSLLVSKGFEFDLERRRFAAMPESRVYLDHESPAVIYNSTASGPLIAEHGSFVEVSGWDHRRLLSYPNGIDPRETRIASDIADLLGSFSELDARENFILVHGIPASE